MELNDSISSEYSGISGYYGIGWNVFSYYASRCNNSSGGYSNPMQNNSPMTNPYVILNHSGFHNIHTGIFHWHDNIIESVIATDTSHK